jgi:PKD repeat protein
MMSAAMLVTVPTNVVAQNEPPVADAGGPYSAPEGTAIVFNASGSTDPNPDVLQYRWDFDNDGLWDTGFSTDSTAVNTWYDDYSGLVVVNVSDGEFNVTDTADLTVTNADPIPYAGENFTIDQGDWFTITVSFTDPGLGDNHIGSLMVDDGLRGDHGPAPKLVLDNVEYDSVILHMTLHANAEDVNDLELKAERGEIASMTVGTDAPITPPTPVSEYSLDFATIVAWDSIAVDVEMEPEPSTCINQTEIWALQWETTFDNVVLSSGLFTNATMECPITIEKPPIPPCGLPFHNITYTVRDDNSGTGTALVQVEVMNVLPVVNAGPNQTVNVGEVVTFSGSFTDPGLRETHTIEWDFGDGEEANDSLTPTHTYDTPGTYTVTLTVTDKYDGVGTDTLTVTVKGDEVDWTLIITILAILILIVIFVIVAYYLKGRGPKGPSKEE